MKIIDLLNKIANGEEVPKKIKYKDFIYEYYEKETVRDYRCYDEETELYGYLSSCVDYETFNILDNEVEILEEENKKCTVETCCIGIEGLSKALLKIKDDMKSIYENIDKAETLEEEKKIPEKLDLAWQNAFDEQVQQDCIKMILENINIILDYLKSKGE